MGGRGILAALAQVYEYRYWGTKTGEPMTADEKIDELILESEDLESSIFCLFVILCELVPSSDKSLREKLAPLLQQAREILSDYPDINNGTFDLNAPAVSEEDLEKFFEPPSDK